MESQGTVSPEELLKMDLTALRSLRVDQVDRLLGKEEFNHIFRKCDALWLHSGDPKDPHAELTSGKCSNGFVNVLKALQFTNICLIMADQGVRRIRAHMQDASHNGNVGWVIGSDHAGATLSFAMACPYGARHDFTEKGPDKTQIWKRFEIEPGEAVLQVEELVTTSGTMNAVRAGIREGNPIPVEFAPFVFTLVHRSKEYVLEDSPILYAVHYDIEAWEPNACPLCQAGSKRLRPKQHWAELTAQAA